MDTLRLDEIEVANYRCFGQCDVRFHPKLTVFVAENGQGKTALLDAVAIALGPVVDHLVGTRLSAGVAADDVRRVPNADGEMEFSVPTELSARGLVDGERLRWAVRKTSHSPRGRTSTKDLKLLRSRTDAMRMRLDHYAREERELPPPLPLIAYYGTGRLWAEERLTAARRHRDVTVLGRLGGYQDFASSASSFKTFSAWYGDMALQARSGTLAAVSSSENPIRFLSCVRRAVSVVLEPTGWTTIDWEWPAPHQKAASQLPSEGHLVVEHKVHGRHPLSRLSDGVRNTVALVADVARRCVRLNPQFGEDAAHRTPGVLLIDEVDMHLHPGWQQEVVGLLQDAFPLVQLIVTTHSPQVLSTVDRESIRVITVDDGLAVLRQPMYQTRGVESADVLARVMGVHSVPRVKEARWLSHYRALLQEGKEESPAAVELWERLVDHFGGEHPLMLEVETLRRLQEFKRAHATTRG